MNTSIPTTAKITILLVAVLIGAGCQPVHMPPNLEERAAIRRSMSNLTPQEVREYVSSEMERIAKGIIAGEDLGVLSSYDELLELHALRFEATGGEGIPTSALELLRPPVEETPQEYAQRYYEATWREPVENLRLDSVTAQLVADTLLEAYAHNTGLNRQVGRGEIAYSESFYMMRDPLDELEEVLSRWEIAALLEQHIEKDQEFRDGEKQEREIRRKMGDEYMDALREQYPRRAKNNAPGP
ncbi:MAG: hypothetical protein ACR2PR_09955 [Pseudohongiellaceae bacterium]